MKIWTLLFPLVLLCIIPLFGFGQTCNNWAKISPALSGIEIGDLDITGDQITVEAVFNRTARYVSNPDSNRVGDIVSKHTDTGNINYLLRPNHAYITTTNGFFETPEPCSSKLNTTYHVALVYDGTTLKFYRNGFLLGEIPATGNLIQSDLTTIIGSYQGPTKENLIGYINEVRIWNVARTQSEIRQYMYQPLPNPASQTGLFAYYTFDNLKNKQGNNQWDGSIIGDAKINQANPACSTFVADSCAINSVNVIPGFIGPDTTCANTPVQFQNTSVNASNYYWSFCTAGFNTTPQAQNLGNPDGTLNTPVFMDYALDDNGSYYGFITSYVTGKITKLNYGNSLLNTPAATDLGNFGGVIPIYAEGIQVKKFNGKCYVFVVAAGDDNGNGSVLIRLDFGSSFSNIPTVNNLGNIGALLFPHDLFITSENNNFYGFTINIRDNTITRFDFGNDLKKIPTGTNLGGIGNLNYPCGFSFINTGGNWYAFVTNRDDNSIARLNFGNSLINIPTGVNIGNPGNFLNRPRDISIFQSCEGIVGLVVNEEDETTGTITKLDFGNNILLSPQASDLGNLGNLEFPHSISKFFLEGNDIYSFITNVANNTITRLRYTGCTNTNIASSTLQTPLPVTYTTPGVYNVNLLVDIGLPTQSSFCKQIIVLDCDTICDMNADFKYAQNSCKPESVHFKSITSNADSIWWDFGNGKKAGNVSDTTIQYAAFGNYVVKLFAKANAGCFDTAEYTVNVNVVKDSAIINRDTSICAGSSIQMMAVKGWSYCWSPSASLSNTSMQNPIASPAATTKYYLQILTDSTRPVILDSVTITVISSPDVKVNNDTIVCGNASVQLNASGAVSYVWSPLMGLSNGTIANPVASPAITTTYTVTGTNISLCSNKDSVIITVNPVPVFTVTPQSTDVCLGDSVILIASGGDAYQWSPASTIVNPFVDAATVFPASNTTYKVIITNNVCKLADTLTTSVSVKELPAVTISKSNDIDCINYQAQLTATGGIKYNWLPATYINNTHVSNPIVNPPIDTWYSVTIDGVNNCSNKDSILVKSLFNPEAVKFEIATAFTPNHDGLNDCFSVKYWNQADVFDISIYNRFGQVVFHSKNVGECWDGTFKGMPQPTGTYVYKISVSTNCSEGLLHKNGTLVLIR